MAADASKFQDLCKLLVAADEDSARRLTENLNPSSVVNVENRFNQITGHPLNKLNVSYRRTWTSYRSSSNRKWKLFVQLHFAEPVWK